MNFINNPGAGPSAGFPGIWTMPVSQALPVDAVPGVWTIAAGTQALTSSWLTGNLFDVQSGGTQTIKAIAGQPDIVTLAGLMGVDPHAGIGGLPCSTWYDQSGNGHNLTQGTTGIQPFVVLIYGQVFMATDGFMLNFISSAFNLDKFFSWPSITTNNQALSVYALLQSSSGGAPGFGSSYFATPFTNTATSSSGFFASTGPSSGTTAPLWNAFDWVGLTVHASTLFPETQPLVLGIISGTGATNLIFTQNEETSTVTSIPAGTSTGGSYGAATYLNAGSNATGLYAKTTAFMVATSALNSTQQTTMRKSLYQMGEIDSAPIYSLLVDGASVDVGQGALVGASGVQCYGWVEQMLAQLPTGIRVGNTSTPGITIANLTATWATAQKNFYSASYTKNILIGPSFAGGNSIAGGETGAQAFADLQSYLTAAKAAGAWTAILVGTLPASAPTGNQELIYNSLVRANAAALGITVVDLAALPAPIGTWTTSNATYFNQSSPFTNHPTVLGYSVLAGAYLAAVEAVLGI